MAHNGFWAAHVTCQVVQAISVADIYSVSDESFESDSTWLHWARLSHAPAGQIMRFDHSDYLVSDAKRTSLSLQMASSVGQRH